jgi:hypothetical protein
MFLNAGGHCFEQLLRNLVKKVNLLTKYLFTDESSLGTCIADVSFVCVELVFSFSQHRTVDYKI